MEMMRLRLTEKVQLSRVEKSQFLVLGQKRASTAEKS